MKPTALHLFSGIGGGALGFQKGGFRCVGAFDSDAAACRDFEQLVGSPATCADLGTLTPLELRQAVGEKRPDVVFTSPPCKGFSGCLPNERSRSGKYVAMNSLALRGVWLALEAWDEPPPLLLLENVPRIQSRGAEFLDRIEALLQHYGYAVARSTHDCGELGGLAQHRRRFLLAARHMNQVPAFFHVPPKRRVRAIGEVLGELPCPVPGSTAGGPLHRLPRLSALNWIRLALIPARGDWRDLPPEVRLPVRAARQNGPFGVEQWDGPSHAVLGNHTARDTWGSVADPRVVCQRREGGNGVKGWDQPSSPIIGHPTIDNFPAQVADPRLSLGKNAHCGLYGVQQWAVQSHTVRAAFGVRNAPAAVADPRVPEVVGVLIDVDSKRPVHLVIRAADGTWHRPMTTLELAALQGFPTRIGDGWLELDGNAHRRWREAIGNAVPLPAAEAIARSCAASLAAAGMGFHLDPEPIWVREAMEVLAT